MAVQVSYPGVYIEEFTPGAPIQGVGTSTAGFIGVASRGPLGVPTLIQSWDAFVATFGGFIAEQPTGYLAPAVFGFFLNGGTTCYVLRVGTGVQATANLTARGPSTDPALIATAIEEGTGGNSIQVQVVDRSRLEDQLDATGSTDTILEPVHFESNITSFDSTDTRTEVTVADASGFVVGDRVTLEEGTETHTGIAETVNTTTNVITLNAPVAGTHDYTGGTLRSANLTPGVTRIRLTVPSGLRLNQALPRGAAISITRDATSEVATVESSGGDTITLASGLSNTYSMDDPSNLPQIASQEFDLIISNTTLGTTETFEGLGMHPNHPNYWGNSVNSGLINLTEPAAPPSPIPDDARPTANTYNLANGQPDDRLAALGLLQANPSDYLDELRPIDEIALVAIPGETDAAVQQAVRDHCESMYDRFAVLDSVRGATLTEVRDQIADVRSAKGFAALYYPWIIARNPLTGRDELIPPSGHVIGAMARTDNERGVHKAPANTNLRGSLGVERMMTNAEQGPLNLDGVNVIRVFPGQSQPVVWGARTTATTIDNNWQYINIRRLFLFLEESIEEGIRWAVFEPNNLQLWQKLKRTIGEFLNRVWRDGALFGATPDEAFYVRIDEILNPFSEQALGRLNIEIGVRPTYPAEFIIVRIGIWDGGSEVSES